MKISFSHATRANWVFIVPTVVIWVSSLLVSAWDFIYLQGVTYRFGPLSVLELILFLIGQIIRRMGKKALRKQYSYSLKPPEILVKRGLYKRVRHPIYLAIPLYTAGIPLFFSSLYSFLVTLGFIPFTLYRIRIEEKMLIDTFGDEY